MVEERREKRRLENIRAIGSAAVALSLFLLMLNIHGAYQMCVCVTAFLLFLRRKNFDWALTTTDLAVAAITALWIISPSWALCRTAAIRTAGLSVSLFGFYCLTRVSFRNPTDRQRTVDLTAIAFGIAELIALLTFFYHFKEARRLGFSDMYPLRYLFRPFAETNNCWAQISIIGMCICSLSSRLRLITTCLCSVGALLTFSRGAYLALLLIVLTTGFMSLKMRHLRSAVAGIAVGVISVSVMFPEETATVVSATSTQSQRKSIVWRKDSSERALRMSGSHLVLGTGGRSFSLVCDSPDRADSAFSNYPPNLLSEILVEKGIVGIIVYGWLLALITAGILRPDGDLPAVLISCMLLIILIKDMTHATLQSSLPGSFAFVLLLAAGQSCRPGNTGIMLRNPYYPTGACLVMLAMMIVPVESFRPASERNIISAIAGLRKGDDDEAARALRELSVCPAEKLDPYPDLLLVGLLIRQKRYPEAKEVIDGLESDSGYKSFYSGLVNLQRGDSTGACECLSQALSRIPALARCEEYRCLPPAVKAEVLDKALRHVGDLTGNGNSIKGALLHYSGFHKQAETYLRAALEENPALQVPYRLLGDNGRYSYLKYGALLTRRVNNDSAIPSIQNLILNEYSSRYRIWYSIK